MSLSPVALSQLILTLCQTRLRVIQTDTLPTGSLLVVSNHRSFMDPLALMMALQRPIRFACHPYMVRVPGLADLVRSLGCIPLDSYQDFLPQAQRCWQQGQAVGIFPEGATRMLVPGAAHDVSEFQRGFVHLALRSRQEVLPIVPIALRVRQEWLAPALPLSMFQWFDPDEPLFQHGSEHPVVGYQELEVVIMPPLYIHRDACHDRHYAASLAHSITEQVRAHV